MATPNQEYIEKAVITTEALATAGKLNPAQADKFIDFVIDETGLAEMGIRIERFRNEKWEVDKINVANRVAVAADEAADPQLRRGVSHTKVTLEPKEIMVPFELGDLYKQHSIEGESAEEHVIRMMAKRMANNVEELYLDGNLLGPGVPESDLIEGGSSTLYRKDRYLGLLDGLLKQAEAGHVFDAVNGRIDPTRFSRALRRMPNKFRRNRSNLRHILSWDHEQHYREGVATRATASGDDALAGNKAITAFGVPWQPLSLMESNPLYVEHVVLPGTTPVQLQHAPITEVIASSETLGKNPETPFLLGTDYSVVLATGVITRIGGAIGDGDTVKVTYRTAGRTLITDPRNIIIGIGLDVTIEKDRNIYKRMNEFAIFAQIDIKFEEVDATVLMKNLLVPE